MWSLPSRRSSVADLHPARRGRSSDSSPETQAVRLKRPTGTGQDESGLAQQRRDLLRDAIVDIQGSVRANDAKCSAALVVHGLLFAGVLTITRELGPVFETAGFVERGAIILTLGAALFCFMTSVWKLARAASPYEPTKLARKIADRHDQVFFPSLETLRPKRFGCGDEFDVYNGKINKLTSARIERDYAAEVLKLADIREQQAREAQSGYKWLQGVLVAVAAHLIVVGILAVSQLGG